MVLTDNALAHHAEFAVKHRLRKMLSPGAGTLEQVGGVQVQLFRGQGAVGGDGGFQIFWFQGIAHGLVEGVAEPFKVVPGNGHAGGHGVAAVFFHQPRVLRVDHGQGVADVKAGDGAGRAFEVFAVVIGREGDGGAVGLFADSGGQDADHALVPVLVEQGQAPGQAFDVEGHGGKQVLGLGFHVFFDAAPFAVEVVQFPGEAQGFVAAVGEQAGDADAHVVQPAGGVQARAHNKTEVRSADFGVVAAGHFQQGQDARAGFAFADAADALLYENPVVVVQRNYVSHGTQSHQVQQVAQVGLWVWQQVVVPQVFAQGGEHVEHHADTGGVLAQERAARLVRVHDGVGVRQFVTGQVVIGDDHLDAQLPGSTHTVDGGNTVIDRNEQVR